MTLAPFNVPSLAPHHRGTYDSLLSGWLESLTENAQRSYQADLQDFADWASGGRADVDVATAMQALFMRSSTEANAMVLAYRQHLLSAPVYDSRASRLAGDEPDRVGFAPATVNRRLSALRSVSKIARITGLFDGTIEISGVRGNRTKAGPGVGRDTYLSMLAEIERRLQALREFPMRTRRREFECLRDRVVLRLLHDMFLRRVEVVRLELRDVDLEGLMLNVQSKGSRGRRDDVPLTQRVADYIAEYVSARGRKPGALICTYDRSGDVMDVSSINLLCARRGRHVGASAQPHSLRRTAITTGLELSNGDVRSVATAARHRNPSTTMRYDTKPIQAARSLSDKIGEG